MHLKRVAVHRPSAEQEMVYIVIVALADCFLVLQNFFTVVSILFVVVRSIQDIYIGLYLFASN